MLEVICKQCLGILFRGFCGALISRATLFKEIVARSLVLCLLGCLVGESACRAKTCLRAVPITLLLPRVVWSVHATVRLSGLGDVSLHTFPACFSDKQSSQPASLPVACFLRFAPTKCITAAANGYSAATHVCLVTTRGLAKLSNSANKH